MTGRRKWWSRARRVLLLLITLLVILPLWPAWWALCSDRDSRVPVPVGQIDDASRLNAVNVAERVVLGAELDALIPVLRLHLARARQENRSVSIGGARHSMGGQSIASDGILIDMAKVAWMELNEDKTMLRVGAGARWSAAIAYLNKYDCSVAVMQSNNSFSVGGSISVNCHGWQFGQPPIADTVASFSLMKADGEVLHCSRSENAELFSLVLGGYGLFGVILEVSLKVVPNERYRLEQYMVPSTEAIALYEAKVAQGDVAMAYGRMRVDAAMFLGEVIINVFRRDEDQVIAHEALKEPDMSVIRRSLFRGSVGSNYGKRLRWWAETVVQPKIRSGEVWRNDLMNEPVSVFENRKDANTDILHEYFVPKDQVGPFIAALRSIIPAQGGNLLNITVRHVSTDEDTYLRYADQPMFAFVMLFNQERTKDGEAQMQELTRALIDTSIDLGGRYYLPYRLHATPEQFHRAYPMAEAFFERKAHYDPDLLFQNAFYRRYAPKP
ncbi:MAG: FAD-binding oxidoreductase [Verrucomicrobiota bacterium]